MSVFETIAPALAGALAARGYETLTPVQMAVLAPEAATADLLVSAQTGSGKTVAFGIAIAPTLLGDAVRFNEIGAPLALVIAPTRELALQVKRELEWLYKDAGARLVSCVGGMDMRTERRALADGAHIVVGTPGRLRDHITRNSLDISGLRAVVLDEADEMLDLGFRDDLEFILGEAPAERRTLMFSATVPRPIAQLAKTYQRDALRISAAGESSQHVDIDYRLMLVAGTEREHAIINSLLFFDAQSTLVFCSTRESVKHLSSRLANRGFPVVALSGELSQAERTNALQSMRDGRARVCVATDVAARGIDLPNLDLVIHADLPTNPDTLLHRSGRTGRAGRKGICVLIVPYHRRGAASRLLMAARLEATTIEAPSSAAIEIRNRQRILEDPALSADASEEELIFARELLAAHSAEQIATAFLRQQLAARPAAEELSEGPKPVLKAAKGEKPSPRFEKNEGPALRFDNGVWFSLSLGRKQRADPKWLLPMICKAGGVTKREVGSIKILDAETRFEIAPDAADAFAAMIRENGSGERGVMISLFEDGAPQPARPEQPHLKATYVPRVDAAAPPPKPAKPGKHKYGSSTKDRRKTGDTQGATGKRNDGTKVFKPKARGSKPVAS